MPVLSYENPAMTPRSLIVRATLTVPPGSVPRSTRRSPSHTTACGWPPMTSGLLWLSPTTTPRSLTSRSNAAPDGKSDGKRVVSPPAERNACAPPASTAITPTTSPRRLMARPML